MGMTFLRVNTAKISRDKVYTFLSSRGVPVEKTLNSKVGLLMTSKQKMLELPEYKLGYFEIQDESSQLISRQVDAKRRLRKAGIQNYMLLPPSHPLLPKLRMKMDWVLVDAPCSQTGALRRNPDMKWAYSDKRMWQWVGQQREIFETALKYVKDG